MQGHCGEQETILCHIFHILIVRVMTKSYKTSYKNCQKSLEMIKGLNITTCDLGVGLTDVVYIGKQKNEYIDISTQYLYTTVP